MITPKNIFKILTWPFLLIMFLAGILFAEEKKTLSPAPPETQKECDQNEQKTSTFDPSVSSPMAPSKEKTGNPNPLTPPPLKIQEGTDTGG